MAAFTLSVERGGRQYEATYTFGLGTVLVECDGGVGSGPAMGDPHAAARALLEKIIDVYERSPRE
jgi:hypothetical protein